VPVSELPTTVYMPESPLRSPATFVRAALADLLASRDLAWRLFMRDFSAQYRNSLLGYLWIFIPPLATGLPFVYLDASGIVRMGDTAIPYAAYAMVGTIIWQVFVDAMQSPLRTMTNARPMLARINFPREAVLLSGLLQVGFGVLVRLLLLAGLFAWFGIVPSATVLLFPVGVLALMMFGLMLGMIITPLGLLYSDVQQALPIATMGLMLLTPVLYPVPQDGFAARIAAWNPLTPLVASTRDWLTAGTVAPADGFILVSVVSAACLLAGWLVFRVALPHLIARLGN